MDPHPDDPTERLLPSPPDPAPPSPSPSPAYAPSSPSPSYALRLRGWLTYAFASEVFAVCALGLFLPICLEQFARDNGLLMPDRLVPCVARVSAAAARVGAGVGVGNTTLVVPEGAEAMRCVVRIGWAWVDTASFSLYVFSTSVAVQALTVISMGGLADHPTQRKPLLLTFASLGSLSASLFLLLPSFSPLWPLCALLAILANVAFGASIVALNSYLPGLARDSREAREKLAEVEEVGKQGGDGAGDGGDDGGAGEGADTDEIRHALQAYNETVSKMTSRISSRGIALGYAAGILVLLLLLIPVTLLKGSTFSLRLCVGLTGVWWALFTLPAALWLPGASASAPKPVHSTMDDIAPPPPDRFSYLSEIARAWAQLGRMLLPSQMRKLAHTFRFLAAWFLLSDAFTTISSTAILFAKTTLHLPSTALILIAVLAPLAGVGGALGCTALQHRFRWSNLRVLLALVGAVSLVPAYGCLGFFVPPAPGEPGAFKLGGLRTAGEMYALAVYYGAIMGAFQAYARAVFAELLPRGEEARWFGLYSITDKSSSFVGPLVVGLLADRTGDIRNAFWFLLAVVGMAVPVLAGIDVRRGREDAGRYAGERGRARGGHGVGDGRDGAGEGEREGLVVGGEREGEREV